MFLPYIYLCTLSESVGSVCLLIEEDGGWRWLTVEKCRNMPEGRCRHAGMDSGRVDSGHFYIRVFLMFSAWSQRGSWVVNADLAQRQSAQLVQLVTWSRVGGNTSLMDPYNLSDLCSTNWKEVFGKFSVILSIIFDLCQNFAPLFH